MKLFKCSKSFIIDDTMIIYSDECGEGQVCSTTIEQTEKQDAILLFESSDYNFDRKYRNKILEYGSLGGNPLSFYYDKVTHELVCIYNQTNTSIEVSTLKEDWILKYPNYKKVHIGNLGCYVSIVKYDFVYWNGYIEASEPGGMTVLVSDDKVDFIIETAKANNLTSYVSDMPMI